MLESGLTGLDHVAGLATPTGLTGGSDRSIWNPSTTRTLCRFRSVIGFLVMLLVKIQSSGNLSDFVSGIIKDFNDKENSSIQAPVVQKSVIESRLIILAKICLFVMLLVKIQFGRLKPKL